MARPRTRTRHDVAHGEVAVISHRRKSMRLAANQFTFTLPAWIDDLLADVPEVIPTREERMQLVHRLADRNWREGNGGPFAALVAESATGRIVSVGVNVVLTSGVSSGHAEVTALGTAQKAVGSWDLGGAGLPEHELVVNWRPCAQCYGATMWSGVRTMVSLAPVPSSRRSRRSTKDRYATTGPSSSSPAASTSFTTWRRKGRSRCSAHTARPSMRVV